MYILIILILLSIVHSSDAFTGSRLAGRPSFLLRAVGEINSVADLDAALDSAGSSIVVVDYSTTWCGPCKLVYPKFVELSDRLADVKFYKCVGDASKEASALMKREGVRSVPTFHIWKNKSKVDVVNGARIEEVEASIVSATKSTD